MSLCARRLKEEQEYLLWFLADHPDSLQCLQRLKEVELSLSLARARSLSVCASLAYDSASPPTRSTTPWACFSDHRSERQTATERLIETERQTETERHRRT